MTNKTLTLAIAGILSISAATASAEVSDGFNWADDVFAYSANIQNYAGQLMDDTTEYWVLGPSDADEQDTVAGWRSNAPDEFITLHWDLGIDDLAGDDLSIRYFSGSGAAADVFASIDGIDFDLIGTITGGTGGGFTDLTFNLAGTFAEDIHYVKVERTANGPQTGLFFDSFAGVVPEPTSLMLLGLGAFLLRRRSR